jgi:hypothetical protein
MSMERGATHRWGITKRLNSIVVARILVRKIILSSDFTVDFSELQGGGILFIVSVLLVTRVKYRGLSLASRSLCGRTAAGGKVAVEIDYVRHYILPDLCNLLAVKLCRMDETGRNWGNRNRLRYGSAYS